MHRDERRIGTRVDDELVPHAFGIGEPKPVGVAVGLGAFGGQAGRPEVESVH